MEERLIEIKDLADRTNLPRSWWYARTAAKEVPFYKLGKYCRFKWSEVEAWLEARRRG